MSEEQSRETFEKLFNDHDDELGCKDSCWFTFKAGAEYGVAQSQAREGVLREALEGLLRASNDVRSKVKFSMDHSIRAGAHQEFLEEDREDWQALLLAFEKAKTALSLTPSVGGANNPISDADETRGKGVIAYCPLCENSFPAGWYDAPCPNCAIPQDAPDGGER